jgi:hypothetical protein
MLFLTEFWPFQALTHPQTHRIAEGLEWQIRTPDFLHHGKVHTAIYPPYLTAENNDLKITKRAKE